MQRDTDGWHLELVAFGGGRARADERVAAVGSFKELRDSGFVNGREQVL